MDSTSTVNTTGGGESGISTASYTLPDTNKQIFYFINSSTIQNGYLQNNYFSTVDNQEYISYNDLRNYLIKFLITDYTTNKYYEFVDMGEYGIWETCNYDTQETHNPSNTGICGFWRVSKLFFYHTELSDTHETIAETLSDYDDYDEGEQYVSSYKDYDIVRNDVFRLPTPQEFEKLLECPHAWAIFDSSTVGLLFTHPVSGNQLFLPYISTDFPQFYDGVYTLCTYLCGTGVEDGVELDNDKHNYFLGLQYSTSTGLYSGAQVYNMYDILSATSNSSWHKAHPFFIRRIMK